MVSCTYEYFQIELCGIGLFIQIKKCATWSPSNLSPNFDTPSMFNTPLEIIRVLGVPLGILSFTLFFIKDILLEDVQHVDLLPKMGNFQIAFGILTHCLVQ